MAKRPGKGRAARQQARRRLVEHKRGAWRGWHPDEWGMPVPRTLAEYRAYMARYQPPARRGGPAS